MSIIVVFMALSKSPKMDLECPLTFFFLLTFQFTRFLNTFERWNSWCGLDHRSVWVFFLIFKIGFPSLRRRLTPPKVKSIYLILRHFQIALVCWNFGCAMEPSFCMWFFWFYEIRVPPPLSTLQKSNSSFFVRFFWNWALLLPLGPPEKKFAPKKVKFFIFCAILMKFETKHFNIFTNNIRD